MAAMVWAAFSPGVATFDKYLVYLFLQSRLLCLREVSDFRGGIVLMWFVINMVLYE